MYDQTKPTTRYIDLLGHTDTFKFLFIPYIRVVEKELSKLIFLSDLDKALVNAYPLWEESKHGLHDGHVFLVFDNHKIAGVSREWRDFVTSDFVEDKWVKAPSEDERPRYTVVMLAIKQDVADKFILGSYSKMFNHKHLKEEWPSFRSQRGIKAPVGSGKEEVRLSKEYHILTRSKLYERVMARSLKVPYRLFKDKLAELKSPPDLKDERLRLNLLHKQILSNE